MTELGRTNSLPRVMLVSCLILLLLRALVICYGTYFPPKRTQDLLVWQQPKPIEPNRKDLLSTPTLYYFCDEKNLLGIVLTNLFENTLFNNRDVVELIRNNFIPVKVERQENAPHQLFDDLSQKFSCEVFPCMVVTLSNGTKVSYTSWQSDRMLIAILKDALSQCSLSAAQEAMLKGNFGLACQAFAKIKSEKSDLRWTLSDDRLANTIHWFFALKHERREKEAAAVLGETLSVWLNRFPNHERIWPIPCLRYLAGQVSIDDVLKETDQYGGPLVTAHYVIGVQSELNGDLETARKHLRLAVAKKQDEDRDDYKLARAELRLMGEAVPSSEGD
ncbi:MAG: hypothetical protein C5B53_08800 [Candidatus Melainabacteria bacterium]|nr:MAG: hypothetical protein C5B53_08800 [Candidatus Melainabacteria bacterium]